MSEPLQPSEIRSLTAAYHHLLTQPNIVSLDYGEKKVGGQGTGRKALVVGVIAKKRVSELTGSDKPVPSTVSILRDGATISLESDVFEEGEITALAAVP